MANSIGLGKPERGKKAPERKIIGIMRKFMMSWKPCISSRVEAIAVPREVNKSATRKVKAKAGSRWPKV